MVKEVAAVVPYGYMHPTLAYSLTFMNNCWCLNVLKSQIYPTCKEKTVFCKAGTSWLPVYCVVSFTDTMRVGKKKKTQTKVLYGKKLPYKSMNDITLNLIQTRNGLIPFL